MEVPYPKAIGQGVRNLRVVERSPENRYKLVFFDQDKVYIGDDVYPLSKGLLELLFKKISDEKLINDQDFKHYDILLKNNAHRVQNRTSGRLQTCNVPKYRLISELLGMTGAGLRSNPLKAMIDDLVAKKNENTFDDIKDSRGSTVQNQNNSSKNKVREDDYGMDMDEEEADDTEDDDRESELILYCGIAIAVRLQLQFLLLYCDSSK